jgi:hypothetical protein
MWLALIRDEKLYEATIDGTHAPLAAARGFLPEDVRILDEFHAEPGLRWNVENLRYRSAAHTAGNLLLTMMRTIYLLTLGNEDWIQELVFEYLAYHDWCECGHEHIAEAERFAAYVKKRVLKRRGPPKYIDEVLDFELVVARHLGALKNLRADEWPTLRELGVEQVACAKPRRAANTALINLPIDLTDWIRSGDPRTGVVREQPVSVLVTVPSQNAPHRFQRMSTAVRELYTRFDGTSTTDTIIAALGEDYDRDDALELVARWVAAGSLAI